MTSLLDFPEIREIGGQKKASCEGGKTFTWGALHGMHSCLDLRKTLNNLQHLSIPQTCVQGVNCSGMWQSCGRIAYRDGRQSKQSVNKGSTGSAIKLSTCLQAGRGDLRSEHLGSFYMLSCWQVQQIHVQEVIYIQLHTVAVSPTRQTYWGCWMFLDVPSLQKTDSVECKTHHESTLPMGVTLQNSILGFCCLNKAPTWSC